jgi:hypothetical protein
MSRTEPIVPTETLHTAGRRVVGAPFRLRTYGNLLYLLLAFPFGVVSAVGVVTGTAVGVGLLLTWTGLPILLVTLAGATAAAGVEGRLANRLVGVEATVPGALRDLDLRDGVTLPGDGFVAAVRRLVTAPSTWTAVVLSVYKFVVGLVSFVAVVTVGSVAGTLLAAPLLYDAQLGAVTGRYRLGSWTVNSLPEALGVAAVGVLALVVGLNLLNRLARFQARSTVAILRVGCGGT